MNAKIELDCLRTKIEKTQISVPGSSATIRSVAEEHMQEDEEGYASTVYAEGRESEEEMTEIIREVSQDTPIDVSGTPAIFEISRRLDDVEDGASLLE